MGNFASEGNEEGSKAVRLVRFASPVTWRGACLHREREESICLRSEDESSTALKAYA